MIKFENTEVMGWEAAIRGMRNPMNSWEKSDSLFNETKDFDPDYYPCHFKLGKNDYNLMKRLRNAGTDHRKFMRMITVYVDITAPLYWWKEFDTYKVGTVANSCSTMHKIHAKEFTLEDFSCEHLIDYVGGEYHPYGTDRYSTYHANPIDNFECTISTLNKCRLKYIETKDKKYWWQMIQLLPSSYNQKRTVMLNYEVLANIYKSRKNHKLDEWSEHDRIDTKTLKRYYDGNYKLRDQKSLNDIGFCDWIKTLPYSELITGESLSDIPICNEIMEEAKKRKKRIEMSKITISLNKSAIATLLNGGELTIDPSMSNLDNSTEIILKQDDCYFYINVDVTEEEGEE